MQRVVVLGRGGAGKSTFARALGQATGLPVVKLDTRFWDDQLRPLPPAAWARAQAELAAAQRWVMDGDLGPHDDPAVRLARADTLVVLNLPVVVCAWRAARRGCERADFWWWLLTWRARHLPGLLAAAAAAAPHARVHVLRSRGQVRAWLAAAQAATAVRARDGASAAGGGGEPGLVPELLVTDLRASLAFWCGLCGFTVRYDRPQEGFAYLVRGQAHVILEQVGLGRNWVTGPLVAPLGRGVNFQVSIGGDADGGGADGVDGAGTAAGVDGLDGILAALRAARWPLFMEPEVRWYALGDAGLHGVAQVGVRQFLVADPDGYLLRLQAPAGQRKASQPG